MRALNVGIPTALFIERTIRIQDAMVQLDKVKHG
jgi:hypothetical protein